ncbi:cytochrome c4 [Oxalobacteraceae bacterium CAVE-383]|nr:cytochrome c4 [Oxalobacteraceae bacterium CAVE-383]
MNRAFSPFLKSLLTALIAFSSIAASAADAPAAPAKADPAKGEALYSAGDAARNLTACVSCHGAAGNSTITQNPRLAGQHDAYIMKQLKDFKSGDRSNPIMSPLAKLLTDDDIRNLAAYLNAQAPKPGAAKNAATLALGKQIYRGGIADKNVPACAACHGPTGAGIPAQYPRLAGQHQDYTIAELTNFRATTGANVRNNSAPMKTIAARLSDDEIKAVSDYIAGLK